MSNFLKWALMGGNNFYPFENTVYFKIVLRPGRMGEPPPSSSHAGRQEAVTGVEVVLHSK